MSYPKHGEVEKMTLVEQAEYLSALDFDQRQQQLGKLGEEGREKLFQSMDRAVVDQWVEEEKEQFQSLLENQTVEGAEFGSDPQETVKIDGADEPQDRAPDEDSGVIAELVAEKLKLTQELNEANDTNQRYYERFGPLT